MIIEITFRLECRANGTNNADSDWFLAVLFPANQLQILPYNRAVKDLNGHSPASFLDAVGSTFVLKAGGSSNPETPGQIRMYLGGSWYDLGGYCCSAHSSSYPADEGSEDHGLRVVVEIPDGK